jgi:hypothetical protein
MPERTGYLSYKVRFFSRPYSPDCPEEVFSQLQRFVAVRRSVTKVISSSCSQPSPTKE